MHSFTSASSLGFVGCTTKFTPKGAAFLPVSSSNAFNSDFIWMSHSSKPSLVLWFRAGKVPTIPFLQHSTTNFGPEIKNIGAAITGSDKFWMNSAFRLMGSRVKLCLKIGTILLPHGNQLPKLWYFYNSYACITK